MKTNTVLTCLFTASLLISCRPAEESKEATSETSETTEPIAEASAPSTPSEIATGQWVYDDEAHIDWYTAETGKELNDAAREQMRTMLAGNSLRLNEDGTWEMTELSEMYSGMGTWKLNEDASILTLKQKDESQSRDFQILKLTNEQLQIFNEKVEESQKSRVTLFFKAG